MVIQQETLQLKGELQLTSHFHISITQTLLEKQEQHHCFRKVVLLIQHLTAMDTCMTALNA